jgi:nucleoside-diphosphate-sugar epimerase
VDHIAGMVVEAMGLRDVRFEYSGGAGGWPGDVPRFVLDPARINRLGWRARRTSEQAVAEAIRATLAQKKGTEGKKATAAVSENTCVPPLFAVPEALCRS